MYHRSELTANYLRFYEDSVVAEGDDVDTDEDLVVPVAKDGDVDTDEDPVVVDDDVTRDEDPVVAIAADDDVTTDESTALVIDILEGEDDLGTLNDGAGRDTLNGSDILIGGKGEDLLKGGIGEDLFVLTAGDGTDTITDFVLDEDLIGLASELSFEQLLITQGMGEQAADTLISIATTDEVLAVLNGVKADTLNSSAFEPFAG